jgi:hypothetical protein
MNSLTIHILKKYQDKMSQPEKYFCPSLPITPLRYAALEFVSAATYTFRKLCLPNDPAGAGSAGEPSFRPTVRAGSGPTMQGIGNT